MICSDYYDVCEFNRNTTVSNTKLFVLHLYWNLCVVYFVPLITICVFFFLKRKIWFCSINAINICIIFNIRYKSPTQYTKLFYTKQTPLLIFYMQNILKYSVTCKCCTFVSSKPHVNNVLV